MLTINNELPWNVWIWDWQYSFVDWVTGASSWTPEAAPPPLTGVTTPPRPTLARPPPLTVRHPDIIVTSSWHHLLVRPDLRDTRRVKSAQASSRPTPRPALSLFHPADSITANIKNKKPKKVGDLVSWTWSRSLLFPGRNYKWHKEQTRCGP